jgi:outer membrane biosynthesis protein TonB
MRVGLLCFGLSLLPVILAAQEPSPYTSGSGITPPRTLIAPQPAYTAEARAAGITGWVGLSVVVEANGTVRSATIAQSCLGIVSNRREPNGDPFRCRSAKDYEVVNGTQRAKGADPTLGLDQEAVNAVRKWMFSPALRDGRPVAVQIFINVNFHPPSSK